MRTFLKIKVTYFFDQMPRMPVFVGRRLLFAANHNATAVSLDAVSSMRNLSVLLSALDTSRTTRTALAL